MERERRLRRAADFSAAYQHGRGWSNQLLALRVRRNDLPRGRFGFAVGKRVGNAVARNRVKRRLREQVRALAVAEGWDVVIVARQTAAAADSPALREALRSLLRRAGISA